MGTCSTYFSRYCFLYLYLNIWNQSFAPSTWQKCNLVLFYSFKHICVTLCLCFSVSSQTNKSICAASYKSICAKRYKSICAESRAHLLWPYLQIGGCNKLKPGAASYYRPPLTNRLLCTYLSTAHYLNLYLCCGIILYLCFHFLWISQPALLALASNSSAYMFWYVISY